MDSWYVILLFLSTLLQFISSFFAFRLIKAANTAWAVISMALFIMGIRRAQSIWVGLTGANGGYRDWFGAWISLVISILLFIGIWGIAGFFVKRKKTELALLDSELFLARAQQVARLGSYRLDLVTGKWLCSKMLLEIFGIDEDHPRDLQGWLVLVHPDQRQEMSDYFQKEVVGKRQSFDYDYRIIRKSDGAQRWVHGMGILDLDGQGTPVAMVGTIQDITDRMVGDIELRESEKRFRTIVDNVNDGFIIHDYEGNILDCNENECRMLGYTKEELVGRSLKMIDSPEEMLLYPERTRILKSTGKVEFDGRHIRKDGRELPVAISARLISRDGRGITQSFIRDLSDRKKAEQSIRESEQRFKVLAESLPQAVFETDGQGKLLYVNRSACEMFGYELDGGLGTLGALDMVVPADIPRAYGNLKTVFGGMPQVRGNEYTGLRKDGSTFPIIIYANPKYQGNQVTGSIGIIVDATASKYAEMERHQLQEQFFQAQKMDSIGTLAGGIAHDFNNLLSGILGGLSLMETDESLGSESKNELVEMKNLVLRGSGLTRQLLGYARKGKYEPKPLDLILVVSKTADLFGRTRKDLQVRVEALAPKVHVLGDRSQIEQVLMNLFVNAGQAMSQGGRLEIRVGKEELAPGEKAHQTGTPSAYAVIHVKDTGIGMDAATLERMYEPFFSTKAPGKGTGLGLSSVYGIVDNHGGFLKVDSQVGKGTTFRVYLPLTDKTPELESEAADSGLSAQGLTKNSILLVDDEEPILRSCSRHFKTAGFTPLTARSGQEGLELFQIYKDKIAVVILDMVMPGLTGMETFEEMKKLDPGVKVILTTGYVMEGQAASVMAAGCKGFIEKPFTMEALSAKVKESI